MTEEQSKAMDILNLLIKQGDDWLKLLSVDKFASIRDEIAKLLLE